MSKLNKPISLLTTFSNYTATEVLGEGGAGRVYLANDDANTQFAIKVLNPDRATKESLKRFKNEVMFGQRNTHPNVVTIVDNGLLEGANGKHAPFYVMPVYSSSLRKVIGTGLPPVEVMRIFLQILDGVEAAHLQGIFHRDLKMENILYDEAGKRPVIADFGIAHFEQEDLYTAVETKDGTRLANFQYAAPEQRRRGAVVDRRADIYALGLILNELFTGEVPAGTDYRSIESVASDYAYLDGIVAKMIRQSPNDRHQDIMDLKREIDVRGKEFVSYQTLKKFKDQVIVSPGVDDSLLQGDITVVGGDYEGNRLTMILNRRVNDRWIQALRNMGNYEYQHGLEPHRFNVMADRVWVTVDSRNAQVAIDYFKGWIPKATAVYRADLERERAEREMAEKRALQAKISAEEIRLNTLKNLRF